MHPHFLTFNLKEIKKMVVSLNTFATFVKTRRLSGLLALTLTSFVIASSSLIAGPTDDVRVALIGPVSNTYKEAVSALDKENTVEGKQHLYKMKEMMNNVEELCHTTENGLEGIDPKLKSQWADFHRMVTDVRIMAGVLDGDLGKTSYKSNLSELKNRWEKMMNELPKVYTTLTEHGKMTLIMAANSAKFQNLCASCR